MTQLLKLVVKLDDLVLLLTAAAGLEHASIDDLDLLHRVQFLCHVLEQLARKKDQLTRMRSIHGQRGAKDVEPHAVDHLGHVPRPVCLIHRLDLLLREDLLVHTT